MLRIKVENTRAAELRSDGSGRADDYRNGRNIDNSSDDDDKNDDDNTIPSTHWLSEGKLFSIA